MLYFYKEYDKANEGIGQNKAKEGNVDYRFSYFDPSRNRSIDSCSILSEIWFIFPSLMKMIVSALLMSWWEWLTHIIMCWLFRCSSVFIICFSDVASSADVGSSSKNTLGSSRRILARLNRCFSPPEYVHISFSK